eukprot:COSAG01_NODE_4141_length_5297_cov_78.284973_1_plen_758_part_00
MFVAVILENFELADEHKIRAQADVYKIKVAATSKSVAHENLPMGQWRQRCRSLAQNVWFERLVLLMILASSVIMAMEYPAQQTLTDGEDEWQTTLEAVGLVFFIGFCCECVIKLAGYGIAVYWADPWNRLDFSVVVVGLIDITVYLVIGSHNSATRVLRLFRVLRPLRLVKRNQGMVVIVNALIACIPSIASVVGLVALLYVVFAIVGMHLFMGLFFGCSYASDSNNGTSASALDFTSFDEVQCVQYGGTWEHATFYNFDNIFSAFKTLFIISTLEGWVDVLHTMMDTPSADGMPLSKNQSFFSGSLYCCMFVVFGALFAANLFVGVLVSFFGRSSGSALLTDGQRQWVQLNMIAMQLAPDPIAPPSHPLRLVCYKIGDSRTTENFIGSIIILNTAMLMMERFPMDSTEAEIMEIANTVFLLIFSVEASVKLIGLGVRPYFELSAWNRLDFGIVIISWISMAADGLSVFSGGRALRVFRVLLLLKNTASLQTLLRTLVLSLPPAINITSLLMLVLFVFGIVGMQLFGGLPHGEPNQDAINTFDNFDSISAAMRVLFQIATGQDWVSKVQELEEKMTAANYSGVPLVVPFMVAYYISSVFVFVNLFIAVLLENFELTFDPDALDIKTVDLNKFRQAWDEMLPPGPQSTGMPIKKIKRMVEVADLGVLSDVMDDAQWWPHLLVNLGWDTAHQPSDTDVVGFRKVLLSLALMYVSIDALPLEERIAQAQQLKMRVRHFLHCACCVHLFTNSIHTNKCLIA